MRSVSKVGLSAAIAATMAASSAMAEQRQFNLECEVAIHDLNDWNDAIKDHGTVEFRIDLDKAEFCTGPCESVLELDKVTDAKISMVNYNADEDLFVTQIDRQNGTLTQIERKSTRSYAEPKMEGTCTPAPFTGFPSTKF